MINTIVYSDNFSKKKQHEQQHELDKNENTTRIHLGKNKIEYFENQR